MSSHNLDPRHAAAIRHLRSGAYRAAVKIFEQLLAEGRDDPDLLNDTALAYLRAGETESAMNCLNRAVSLEPDHAAGKNLSELLQDTESSENTAIDWSMDGFINGEKKQNKLLFFSPYAIWRTHTLWEATLLHGLEERGHDTKYVLCDGLLRTCDLKMRGQTNCFKCQSDATSIASNLGLNFTWIGRYQYPDDVHEARTWSNDLSVDDFWNAKYSGWEIGKWIKSTVHKNFRCNNIDLRNRKVRSATRDLIESGLLAARSFERLLEDFDPDILFLFNGRHAPYRVAYELAKVHGIRIITHELSPRKDSSVLLVEDARIHDLRARKSFWEEWNSIPLDKREIHKIDKYLRSREIDRDTNSFLVKSKRDYSIPDDCIVLFTSSQDEVIVEDSWNEGPFENQLEWIKRTINIFESHRRTNLIIRLHPNMAGKRAIMGGNSGDLLRFKKIRKNLPKNVHMIMPDEEISSYSLMRCAKAGLIYHSTAGLEMCCKGKFVITAAGSFIRGLSFCETPESKSHYDKQLRRAINLPADFFDPEIKRMAYRFAYGLFYRQIMDLPLIECEPKGHGAVAKLNYEKISDLAPGSSKHLDAICDFILGHRPLISTPSEVDLERTTTAENDFLWGHEKT